MIHRKSCPISRLEGPSYNPETMAEPEETRRSTSPQPGCDRRQPAKADDKVLCERCGAEMFRMHAVWRCPQCRFKTDCCGW